MIVDGPQGYGVSVASVLLLIEDAVFIVADAHSVSTSYTSTPSNVASRKARLCAPYLDSQQLHPIQAYRIASLSLGFVQMGLEQHCVHAK